MSDRDYLDLDEDLLNDGPDAPVGEWDEDLMDDFPADDPAADGDLIAAATPAPEGKKADKAPSKKKDKAKRPKRAPRSGGTGFLCFLLVVLAGLSLATGLMTAAGVVPESLLDFSGFRDPLAIGDFQAHPVNAFWLAAVVTLLAGVMAAVAVDKRLRGLKFATTDQEEILEAICQLDPENVETWEHEGLQADPDVAEVATGLLGHVNLQQAKLERYVGLEGELHRLEKAMADSSLEDLQGDWENPATGSLADQAVRLVQAREELASDTSRTNDALTSQGPDLVAGLRDARGWQGASAAEVKAQGSGIERVFRRLSKLADQAPETDDLAPRRDRLRAAIEAVRQELSSLPTRATDRTEGDGSLGTLIERASRLAFQIAMEVARLGAKGERLLPLTQDLEELTTELRAMMDRDKTQPGEDDPRDKALANVRGRLAELDPDVLTASDDGNAYATAIKELAPAAGEVAAGLAHLAKNFGSQDQRLQELVQLASEMTGIDAPDAGSLDAGGGGMLVDRFDPFASGAQPEGGLMADPFAGGGGGSIFDAGNGDGGSEFGRTVLPGEETPAVSETESEIESESAPAPEPVVESLVEPVSETVSEPVIEPVIEPTIEPMIEPAAELSLDPLPDPAPPAPVESPLPLVDEKVYDLSDFDAQPMAGIQPAGNEQPGAGLADERIYDLSEFGAVRIE